MLILIILIVVVTFIGYDLGCYQLIKLIKGPTSFKYFRVFPGYSIYYFHVFIQRAIKDYDETKNNDS